MTLRPTLSSLSWICSTFVVTHHSDILVLSSSMISVTVYYGIVKQGEGKSWHFTTKAKCFPLNGTRMNILGPIYEHLLMVTFDMHLHGEGSETLAVARLYLTLWQFETPCDMWISLVCYLWKMLFFHQL